MLRKIFGFVSTKELEARIAQTRAELEAKYNDDLAAVVKAKDLEIQTIKDTNAEKKASMEAEAKELQTRLEAAEAKVLELENEESERVRKELIDEFLSLVDEFDALVAFIHEHEYETKHIYTIEDKEVLGGVQGLRKDVNIFKQFQNGRTNEEFVELSLKLRDSVRRLQNTKLRVVEYLDNREWKITKYNAEKLEKAVEELREADLELKPCGEGARKGRTYLNDAITSINSVHGFLTKILDIRR